MIVRVYFYKETNPEIMLGSSKLSRQALSTIYELVWEAEFKNISEPWESLDKVRRRGKSFWDFFKIQTTSFQDNYG